MRKVSGCDYVSIFAGMIPPFGVRGKWGSIPTEEGGIAISKRDGSGRGGPVCPPKGEGMHVCAPYGDIAGDRRGGSRTARAVFAKEQFRHSGACRNPERTGMDERRRRGDSTWVVGFSRYLVLSSVLDSGFHRNDDQTLQQQGRNQICAPTPHSTSFSCARFWPYPPGPTHRWRRRRPSRRVLW